MTSHICLPRKQEQQKEFSLSFKKSTKSHYLLSPPKEESILFFLNNGREKKRGVFGEEKRVFFKKFVLYFSASCWWSRAKSGCLSVGLFLFSLFLGCFPCKWRNREEGATSCKWVMGVIVGSIGGSINAAEVSTQPDGTGGSPFSFVFTWDIFASHLEACAVVFRHGEKWKKGETERLKSVFSPCTFTNFEI